MISEAELKVSRKLLIKSMEQERALLTELARPRCTLNVVEKNSKHVLPMRQTVGQTQRQKRQKDSGQRDRQKRQGDEDIDSDNMPRNNTYK